MSSVVRVHGLSCSVAWGIFLDQGFEPVSPALAGGFLTTVPPGKPQDLFSFLFFLHIYFIILFFGCVGFLLLRAGLFSGCGEWGLLFIAVHGLLIVVASLVAEHGL